MLIDTVTVKTFYDSECNYEMATDTITLGNHVFAVDPTTSYSVATSCIAGVAKPVLPIGTQFSVYVQRYAHCNSSISYFDATVRNFCFQQANLASELLNLPYLTLYNENNCTESIDGSVDLVANSECALVSQESQLYFNWQVVNGTYSQLDHCGKTIYPLFHSIIPNLRSELSSVTNQPAHLPAQWVSIL